MMKHYLSILLILLLPNFLSAQTYPKKIRGFVGLYHPYDGYVYAGENVPDSTRLQDAFNFGCNGILTSFNYGYAFPNYIDSAFNQWKLNKTFGILRSVSSGGVYSNPADTVLLNPVSPNTMLQACARFSRLAEQSPQVSGVIMDDFFYSTLTATQLSDLKLAMYGKYVNSTGAVNPALPATTPHLKLYATIYNTDLSKTPSAAMLNTIDGIIFWLNNTSQNTAYVNLDSYITTIKTKYPKKEIIIGDYISYGSSALSPASIHGVLDRALNQYDDGYIKGVLMFSGHWLSRNLITQTRWNAIDLPHKLNQVYYPYLGEGTGKTMLCNASGTLDSVWIRVYSKGRLSGDTTFIGGQISDASGNYEFGAWAGNRTTDSTYYWVIGSKAGYANDTVGGWIKRQQLSSFPNLEMCPQVTGTHEQTINNELLLTVLSNPSASPVSFRYSIPFSTVVRITIYDLTGREIVTLKDGESRSGTQVIEWNGKDGEGHDLSSSVYFCRLTSSSASVVQKVILLR